MGEIINGAASEYEMPRTPKYYNDDSTSATGLPRLKTFPAMPPVKPVRDQMCEFCAKEDVCNIKDESTKAYKDILDIEGRTNVFINTTVNCKKFLRKIESNGIR
jgi:hypothetical protein